MRNLGICRLLLLCVWVLDVCFITLLFTEDRDLALRFFSAGVALSWLGAAFAAGSYRSSCDASLQRNWWARILNIQLGVAVFFCGLTLTIFAGLYILWLLYLLVYIGVFPMVLPLIALYFVLCFLAIQFIRVLPFVSLSLISTPVLTLLAMRRREWWAVGRGGLSLLLTGVGLRVLHLLHSEDSKELVSLLESALQQWQLWPFGVLIGAVVYSTLDSCSQEIRADFRMRDSAEV